MRVLLIVATVFVETSALADYAQPGTLAVTKSAGSVTVSNTSFPVDAYVPNTGGPWPIIGMGHGFSHSKDNLAVLAQLLATRGNVVVVPQFPSFNSDHARNGQVILAAIDWAIGNQAFAGKVDGTRQALAGHSAGGLSAFLAGASRPSVRAIVLLDAVDNNNAGLTQVPNVKAPVLLTFAEGGTCNSTTNSTAWWTGLTGTKSRLKMMGANHCDASEPSNQLLCNGVCGAPVAARQTLFKRYAVAWMQYFVSCELAAREAVDGTQVTTDTTSGGLTAVQHVQIPSGCMVSDGGVVVIDAGTVIDAGVKVDAGVVVDAGAVVVIDAGVVADAGVAPSDAGVAADAGMTTDAGPGTNDDGGAVVVADAGRPDAGGTGADGGPGGGEMPPRGCGCGGSEWTPSALLGLLAVLRTRRRRSRS